MGVAVTESRQPNPAGDLALLRLLCNNPFLTVLEAARKLGGPPPAEATDAADEGPPEGGAGGSPGLTA